jgi:hypothetical protein
MQVKERNLSNEATIAQTHQRYSGRKRFYKTVSVDEPQPGQVSLSIGNLSALLT